uniref:Odorant binding protein 19 n=1 Tax=Harmonia axyridis TaxID=115357 RepID=A0A8K1AMP3_HARAX|nr:odorant binding protein 19 [Harmonia axyridis]
MKIVLVILLVASVWTGSKGYTSDEWKDFMRNLEAECQKETGVEYAKVLKAKEDESIDKSDKLLLKFVYCVSKTAGFVDDETNLNRDTMKMHLQNFGVSDDDLTKSFQVCSKKTETDIQIQVALFYECFHRYLPLKMKNN